MEKIKEFLAKVWAWVKTDGLLHIETSALIVAVFGILFPWWVGAIVAALAGIGKEVWDIKYGVPSWHDLLFDLIGILIGVLVVIF